MTELSLEDFLSDPTTRQLMARDQIAEADIRAIADSYRASRDAGMAEPRWFEEPKSFER